MGRKQGCVIKTSATAATTKKTTTKKVMPHDEFMKRIRKSLYFGQDLYENETMGVSKPLAEYASELFSDTHRGHTLNRLSCVEASSVVPATPAALIMALIYLDRLYATDPGYVRRITPQELFIVSMMISTKFYAGYDEDIYLSDWAEDGNMSEERIKELELEFLSAIEWNIYISNEQFFDKLTCIEKTLARREGLRRGWLTYSELMQMLPSFTLAKFLLNNITIMAVSYAASVMTIAGAFFLAAQIPGTSLHQRTRTTTSSNDLLNDPEIIRPNATNKTSPTSTSSVIDSNIRPHNHTSMPLGLNVEDELLKLERQYREEAIRDTIRLKNNEIATESRLTLPQQHFMAKLNVNQKCAKYDANQQQRGYWFVHKEEYSELEAGRLPLAMANKLDHHFQSPLIVQHYENSGDIINGMKTTMANYKFNNASITSLFWNYLSDTVHQHATFMRLPFVWLKFM
ncbi:protein CNPPD1 [Stomoxys calcitrans]|uniref:protein CNPPD1 n=1 Tax=Stomoxys calcitrans TaxID=35570 RepID=UPI0027E2DEDC|nr:protein CNPPD1 [Stomoxys calcitrans]XP_059221228.1 protein CNPPD1 [Stomoxys calcitrans]XP_059221230.1 protein CNPPD1 [Stomoxys calcitrans]